MKLIHREIEKNGPGEVTLLCEEAEDLWHVYNLVFAGDTLKSSTIRRVQSTSATGSVGSERLRLTLTLDVDKVEYDPTDLEIRISGRNMTESAHIKMGQHHTISLDATSKFTLRKQVWDVIDIERVETSCDVTTRADVAAVMIQEGLANVCLVTAAMTVLRQRIETQIPRKRKASVAQHQKALERFYDAVLQAVTRHVNFAVVKCCIIAGPGFTKDDFYKFMLRVSPTGSPILENRSKFLLVHASNGHKHGLKEVLVNESVTAQLAETKAAGEVRVLNDFFDKLNNAPEQAFYGLAHVERANQANAIGCLLIADGLFRNSSAEQRHRYGALMESVRDNNGDVRVFSSQHVSGEQLMNITGIAAILRFPLADLEEEVEAAESSSESEGLEAAPVRVPNSARGTPGGAGAGAGASASDTPTSGRGKGNADPDSRETSPRGARESAAAPGDFDDFN